MVNDSFPCTIDEWVEEQQSGGDGALQRLLDLSQTFASTDTAWIHRLSPEDIQSQWAAVTALREAGHVLPLYGVPFAVKDNIDVAGIPTTAACPDFAYTPAEDAKVVSLLRKAGAIAVGKTNLDQFATGLNGTRSPYGAVPNTFDPSFISGGSSSGSASVVARGLVPFALGTDTAGSGRVPAGLNNIIGLKPTVGALSTRGVVPACRTLDCVTILALTVTDAQKVLRIVSHYDVRDSYSKTRPVKSVPKTSDSPRVAICSDPQWFGDDLQKEAYEASLTQIKKLGWEAVPTSFASLFEMARLLYEGPWVAERYHTVKDRISDPKFSMDPTVRAVINTATKFSAVDAFSFEYQRRDLERKIKLELENFNAVLVPTTPVFPSMQQMQADPITQNSNLGTYTNFVNFLGWSAIAFPAGFRTDKLPFGLTLIARDWEEPQLLHWASTFTSAQHSKLGATSRTIQPELIDSKTKMPNGVITSALSSKGDMVHLAVVGAHLNGMPLNFQLTDLGAQLIKSTFTSPNYRLYALPVPKGGVRKPGLLRLPGTEKGHSIAVEVWAVPQELLGGFMVAIPSPLTIGKVELADGSQTTGFLCESQAIEGATDISEHGGWREYLTHERSTALPARPGEPLNFQSILVANRGEIAVRLVSGVQKMGIRAVAVYSNEDASSPHVRMADEAVHLEGDSVAETYLNITAIIDASVRLGVDAILPGYGMLSENAEFAAACEAAGICFIGPTPEQMRNLGLKHACRDLAQKAGVPLVPGSGLLGSVQEALEEADRVGYPVMLKSAAGGGGIGLSQCFTPEDVKKSLPRVQSLAESYFNNDGVFLERLIPSARHIEVQIIGDGAGRVRHVSDRDCSLQRRHQKVIEEAPAVLVPHAVRQKMQASAVALAASVSYRGVGTVEFIYDPEKQSFYFLEVNTRLQVEHPVTEAVGDVDLVESMIRVLRGDSDDTLFPPGLDRYADWKTEGVALEARIYAECPLKGFLPVAGTITLASFPKDEGVRVDTWVHTGTVVSPSYDPLLAKVIVKAANREAAVTALADALAKTRILGIETNIDYLRYIVSLDVFQSGAMTTRTLDELKYEPNLVEVLQVGSLTSIQDWPGRLGLWNIGVPPSGPMDDFAMRLANRAVGNENYGAAAIECGPAGITLRFHQEAVAAVAGPATSVKLDDKPVSHEQRLTIAKGQVLSVGTVKDGCRVYVAVLGGFDVPLEFNSASTFALGVFGGSHGRELQTGDLIPLPPPAKHDQIPGKKLIGKIIDKISPHQSLYPACPTEWKLRAVPGPHTAPRYFSETSFTGLFDHVWEVDYNSSRSGIRINGPRPSWSRKDGGTAGLHPSNIHDSPYAIGSVSFTGDYGIILGPDGPSLGGFVVFCTVIVADLWKLGQMRPGDTLRLLPVSVEDARKEDERQRAAIDSLSPFSEANLTTTLSCPPVYVSGEGKPPLTIYSFGDLGLLIELGVDEFHIQQTFQIYSLLNAHEQGHFEGLAELTPGVRSLHARLKPTGSMSQVAASIADVVNNSSAVKNAEEAVLPSRIIRLPFAFQHSAVLAAIQRYAETIWADAPYVPSNANFLTELNGLSGIDVVAEIMHQATFLVLGLGDVYMGAPCAVPLDPRHRLFGTKYSPTRSFTPEGTVGIGGQYLCIYGGNSPGGYQIVGRTIPIWEQGMGSGESWATEKKKAWRIQMYDRIQFYPVSEQELDAARASGEYEKWVHVKEDERFSLRDYEKWLVDHESSIQAVRAERSAAFVSSPLLAALSTYRERSRATKQDRLIQDDEDPAKTIAATLAGRCWQVFAQPGEKITKGDVVLIIESMKMQVDIRADRSGVCEAVFVEKGDIVKPGERLVTIDYEE